MLIGRSLPSGSGEGYTNLSKDLIVKEIVSRLNDPSVVGLATHRHYPQERIIYEHFGRCGFSVDIMLAGRAARGRTYILVEAVADRSYRQGSYDNSPGRITCLVVEETGEKRRQLVKKGNYSNKKELFEAVEKIRRSFYNKYNRLREISGRKKDVPKVSEEVFHEVGISASDIYLGV